MESPLHPPDASPRLCRQKQNYYPEIYHFFSLVLRKYA